MKLQRFTVPALLVLVSLAGFVAGHLFRGENMQKALVVGFLAAAIVAIATAVAAQGISPTDPS